MTAHNKIIKSFFIAGVAALSLSGCKKFADVPPASNIMNAELVYSDKGTISNAIAGLYVQAYIYGGAAYQVNLSLCPSTSADELEIRGVYAYYEPFTSNNYTPLTAPVGDLWTQFYKEIYLDNALIAGMDKYYPDMSLEIARLAKGEALFMRAFSHFQLVNFFGDVPLAITTDANINGELSRKSKDIVMNQVIEDLKQAKELLNDSYAASGGQRVRPNKFAAAALLARAYQYTNQWSLAEAEANAVISNTSMYKLLPAADIGKLFLKTSQEMIWQMNGSTAGLSSIYNGYSSLTSTLVGSTTPSLVMTDTLIKSFETGDLRFTNWTRSITYSGKTYRQPYKYKATKVTTDATAEALGYLRVAEQILIRAEARAYQNNLAGAISDINLIRSRAGLANTTATTKDEVLAAIFQERKIEFFVENGHRWFDLKRTGKIDQALAGKTGWSAAKALYPIPASEILNNKNLSQNAGY